jgi:hypothetical protein
MAQTLYVKNQDGGQRPVKIIRSWGTSGGTSVYLHANGRYAYKDGKPLRSVNELDILPQVQREAAMAWWKRTGEAEAAAYYSTQLEKAREAAGDFQTEIKNTDELDAVLYARRKSGGTKKTATTAPHTWMEWFKTRPDWWGQARSIAFLDYAYEMAVPAEAPSEEPEAEQKPAAGKTGREGDEE